MSDFSREQKQISKDFITIALFECLEDVPFHRLTVSAVCKTAQISRKTFYRHFESLQDVLDQWFLKLEDLYLKKARLLEGYDLNQIQQEFFSFWMPYQTRLQILLDSGVDLRPFFMKSAKRIIRARAGDSYENLLLFSSGGFYELWLAWILNSSNERPQKKKSDDPDRSAIL